MTFHSQYKKTVHTITVKVKKLSFVDVMWISLALFAVFFIVGLYGK